MNTSEDPIEKENTVRTLGCIQPSYIPWRGYFDIIQRSDVFVFHDDIQYTKQDWRNRNRIKAAQGVTWLTIPIQKQTVSGPINEALIDNAQRWSGKQWRMIDAAYKKSPHFRDYRTFFEEIYNREWTHLSEMCIVLTKQICEWLNIETELMRSSDLDITGAKTDRLVQMCEQLGTRHYLSGPSAKDYIETEKFDAIGTSVEYIAYDYPEYPQLHGEFRGDLSIIDLLFNCGEESPRYIWNDET